MKTKNTLALMTICILSFSSCGKQETTATTESIPTAVESVQVNNIIAVVIEPIPMQYWSED